MTSCYITGCLELYTSGRAMGERWVTVKVCGWVRVGLWLLYAEPDAPLSSPPSLLVFVRWSVVVRKPVRSARDAANHARCARM